ncbi:MAG: hypothetical protein ACOC3G_04805, partial [Phycisphaeraceae bacterium]
EMGVEPVFESGLDHFEVGLAPCGLRGVRYARGSTRFALRISPGHFVEERPVQRSDAVLHVGIGEHALRLGVVFHDPPPHPLKQLDATLGVLRIGAQQELRAFALPIELQAVSDHPMVPAPVTADGVFPHRHALSHGGVFRGRLPAKVSTNPPKSINSPAGIVSTTPLFIHQTAAKTAVVFINSVFKMAYKYTREGR